MLRFLIDESADGRLYDFLRQLGHDVLLVARRFRMGLSDVDVLALAVRERRVLIASDRDFGELVFERRHPHAGVLFLRLKTRDFPTVCARVEHVLMHHRHQLDQFLVITDGDVRPARISLGD